MLPRPGITRQRLDGCFLRPAGWGVFFLLAVLTLGCAKVSVHRLSQQTYPPKSPEETVRLYEGKLQVPHREIAILDSQALPDRSEESRAEQLLQIREAARKLGADAVHNVQGPLPLKIRGFILDQRVPFRAYKQGRYELYIHRGTAVVFVEDATPPAPPEEALPESPVPDATDPEPTKRDAPTPPPTPLALEPPEYP